VIALLAAVFIFVLLGIWGWPLIAGILGISSVGDKPSALQNIRQLMVTYEITPAEVEKAFDATSSVIPDAIDRSKGDVAKTLFIYLGAIFVLSGIGIYVGMFWQSMISVMRIFITLGVGYILLVILISSLQQKKFPSLVLPLTIASVSFLLVGWFVLIDEIFPDGDNWRAATLFVFAMMTLHYGGLFSKYHRLAFAFLALFFVYGFMHIGLEMLGLSMTYVAIILGSSLFLVGTAIEQSPQRVLAELALLIGACWLNGGLFGLIAISTSTNWASIITGVSVTSAAYGMHKAGQYPRLIGLGFLFGSAMFYAGLFDLVQSTSLELIYFAITASLLYVCVKLRSRMLLLTTVLAMLFYTSYFSAKHFSDSLGWPITLVLIGVTFLGIGTMVIKLKKYSCSK
jgi:hypothetical protein